MSEPVIKKAKEDGDLESANENSWFQQLTKLTDFEFVEVLGSSSNYKSIFLLLNKRDEDCPAVLLLNKVAFSESPADLQKLVAGADLVRLSDNDIYGNFELFPPAQFGVLKTMLIYPATQQHIDKYRLRPPHYIMETAQDYKDITLPFIEQSSFSCKWVYNILEGKKEQDQAIYKDTNEQTGFFLLKDIKWDGKTVEEMYYQAIVVRRDLKSVRDLTAKELPLLENIFNSAAKAIRDEHGVEPSKLIAYFHYQPSYYHLHVHFRTTRCDNTISNIPLREVIENLKVWPDFYKKAPLGFLIKDTEELYKRFQKAGRT